MRFVFVALFCAVVVASGLGPAAAEHPQPTTPFAVEGWQVTTRLAPDKPTVDRGVPDEVTAGRLTLALGDPVRLFSGPLGAANQPWSPTASTGLIALRDRVAGLDALAATSAEASDPAGEGTGGEESTQTYRNATAVGDLDGDGIAEVAITTTTYPAGAGTIEVRRGGDQALLWQRPTAYAALTPTGDVDGDGRGDLLLRELAVTVTVDEYDCEPDPSTCTGHYEAALAWTASVVDGATGAVRWRTTHDGSEVYRYTTNDDSLTLEQTVDFLLADPSDDHDGDGRPDVVVSTVGMDYRVTVGSDDQTAGLRLVQTRYVEEALHARTDTAVLTGDTAATILTWVHEEPSQLAVPSANYGDLTGDGTDDVGWEILVLTPADRRCTVVALLGEIDCTTDEPGGVVLRLQPRDGRTGQPLWTAEIDTPFIVFPFADLDGDGVRDMWALGGRSAYETTVVSGRDGTSLWAVAEADYLIPLQAADLDDDGDTDVLAGMFVFDLDTFISELQFHRLDGRTGQTWLTTTPLPAAEPGECGYILTYTFPASDGDRDGIGDVVAGRTSEELGRNCANPAVASSHTTAESSTDGTPLYQHSTDTAVFTLTAGHLDEDVHVDLLVIDDTVGTTQARSGLFGPSLWTLPRETVWNLGADIDGTPGDDLTTITPTATADGDDDEILRLRNGRDLTIRHQAP